MKQKDHQTMAELAKQALHSQGACNLTGLLHGMHKAGCAMIDLGMGTDEINRHPIMRLYATQVAHLTGQAAQSFTDYQHDYAHVDELASKAE